MRKKAEQEAWQLMEVEIEIGPLEPFWWGFAQQQAGIQPSMTLMPLVRHLGTQRVEITGSQERALPQIGPFKYQIDHSVVRSVYLPRLPRYYY